MLDPLPAGRAGSLDLARDEDLVAGTVDDGRAGDAEWRDVPAPRQPGRRPVRAGGDRRSDAEVPHDPAGGRLQPVYIVVLGGDDHLVPGDERLAVDATGEVCRPRRGRSDPPEERSRRPDAVAGVPVVIGEQALRGRSRRWGRACAGTGGRASPGRTARSRIHGGRPSSSSCRRHSRRAWRLQGPQPPRRAATRPAVATGARPGPVIPSHCCPAGPGEPGS